jgi:hypothetical protein
MDTLTFVREWVMDWLDPIGVVVGILIAVPVFWTWWDVVLGAERRRRRWFREACRLPGEAPAILIVDLLPGKDVRTSVERFRSQQEGLREVSAGRVVLVARGDRLGPEDMPKLHEEVRIAAGRFLAMGVDVVHYFHAGPAAIAAIVGAELGNACRVIVYQHDTNGYRSFGPLRLEIL